VSTKNVDAGDYFLYLFRMLPEQCRAARAWLGLSQDDLASAASVGNSTIRDFEAGRRAPIANNLTAIRAALEAQGVVFVDDENAPGISFPQGKTRQKKQ
jgi:ribosome-binding protein aMBF1 (putative translation factor)